MKERCEISKVNKSIGGNKRIGGTFCWKLIKEWSLISAYRQDFFSFSNKRPVRLFGTLEYAHSENISPHGWVVCRWLHWKRLQEAECIYNQINRFLLRSFKYQGRVNYCMKIYRKNNRTQKIYLLTTLEVE